MNAPLLRTAALAVCLWLAACLQGLAQDPNSDRPPGEWSLQKWIMDGFQLGGSVADTSTEQLKSAREFEKAGEKAKALDAYRKLYKHYPISTEAPAAMLRIAQLLEESEDYEKAFSAYDTYLSKFPEGKDFKLALDSMVQLGKRFMNGERRRLFGLKMFSSNQRAEEMFDAILKRAPFSTQAPQVMLYKAAMLERQGKDQEAIAAYQEILERFPSDPAAEDAQYQIGYIRLKNVRDGSNNRQDKIRAQESFEDFLNRAPDSGKAVQAKENLQKLEKGHRQSILEVAKFYEKTGKFKAAAVYYDDLIRISPNSDEGKSAKSRLSALRRTKGEESLAMPRGPAENADIAASKKRMESAINTSSRADYVGPQIKPKPAVEKAPASPSLRVSPRDLEPLDPNVLLSPTTQEPQPGSGKKP
jgi:outer membrane protein assembly factor BamD